METTRRLGKTELALSSIGLGCWQFSEGTGGAGMYWPALPQPAVNDIVEKSLAGGITWFDTAEAYGNGRSEAALAKALTASGKQPGEVLVATKWMPVGRFASNLKGTIGERLARLSPWPIDLYQVHQPWGFSTVEAEMAGMADLVADKKIRTVGVSNFNEERMRRAAAALKARGLVLASNQVKYSLLDRRIETNGVLAAAKELQVTIIAYSPLEQGILSGKFHADPAALKAVHGPRRLRAAFRQAGLERSRPVVEELKKIASAHGVAPAQVALAWLLQFHGETVVAIPGASKPSHVTDNVGAMQLALSKAELDALDVVSRR
jgi:aryl-alcohol dehydrogenase-like predicted oxidoreductase